MAEQNNNVRHCKGCGRPLRRKYYQYCIYCAKKRKREKKQKRKLLKTLRESLTTENTHPLFKTLERKER